MPKATSELLQSELLHMGYTLCTSELPILSKLSGICCIETTDMCYQLKGGELVQVTGCAMRKESDLFSLIRALKKCRCSAVLITLGLYIADIPEDILTYCNDARLPLFSIPKEALSPRKTARLTNIVYSSLFTGAELSSALFHAISSPESYSHYLPVFENNNQGRDSSYCIGIVEIFKYNPDTRQKTYIRNSVGNIRSFLSENHDEVVMTEYNNQFVFMFPGCEDYIARDIIMDIYQLIRSTDVDEYIYLGTSEKILGLTNIYKAYQQADFVTMLKKKSALRTPVIRFSSLTTYKLLASIENREILNAYYRQHLQPLAEYDRVHDSTYFKLLEALISNDFNVAETASKLFMHRNSVNYKINKIESILNCSLNSANERTCLLESYKIWCILYKEESLPDRRHRSPAVTFVSSASGDDRDQISLIAENCSI